jgi:hypothetical protein
MLLLRVSSPLLKLKSKQLKKLSKKHKEMP